MQLTDEARKLIEQYKISEFSTKELVEELRKREGVRAIDISTPDDEYFISTTEDNDIDDIEDSGPAIILIVTD